MQDLGHMLPGSPFTALVPTAQEAGGLVSSNALAMTAPGTEPVTPLPDRDHQADPSLTPLATGRVATDRPHTGHDPSPWTGTGPGGWVQAGDDSGDMTNGWRIP